MDYRIPWMYVRYSEVYWTYVLWKWADTTLNFNSAIRYWKSLITLGKRSPTDYDRVKLYVRINHLGKRMVTVLLKRQSMLLLELLLQTAAAASDAPCCFCCCVYLMLLQYSWIAADCRHTCLLVTPAAAAADCSWFKVLLVMEHDVHVAEINVLSTRPSIAIHSKMSFV